MEQQLSMQRRYLYRIEDIDWNKLSQANIYREDLIEAGQMEVFLQKGATGVMDFNLNMSGISMELSGRLYIKDENGVQTYEVVGIGEEEENGR